MSNNPDPAARHDRPRAVVAFAAAFGLLLSLVAGVAPSAGAADGERSIDANDPPNGRDYWLAGDEVVVEVTCLDDEHRVEQPGVPMSGTSGPDGFVGVIDYFPHSWTPGTYTDIYRCVDDDSNEVREEFTVDYEIRSPVELVATVGTDPDVCATDDEITVEAGTEVFWCYRLLPDPLRSGYPLAGYDEVIHEIADSLNGALGDVTFEFPDVLAPGELPETALPDEGLSTHGLQLVSSSVADDDLENTGSWGITVGYTFYDHETGQDDYAFEALPEALEATARVNVTHAEDEQPDPDGEQPEQGGSAQPATPVSGSPTYTG